MKLTGVLSIDELFKGRHFDREIIVLCVRWYLRFKLSFRDLVEMMAERGLSLAHTRIMRWFSAMFPNSRGVGTASLGRRVYPGALMRPTSKSKDVGLIFIVRSTTRARQSIFCFAPSGMSRPPRHFSGELSGARVDCRIRSRSTVARLRIARQKKLSANVSMAISARSGRPNTSII